MSTSTSKLPYPAAYKLAEKIKDALAPGCQRVEIAGSIRRRKPEIGDIEIVAVPGPDLDSVIADLITAGRLMRGDKNGGKFKNFLVPAVPGLKLDLFLPTAETWGVIFTIRTGSAEFSHKLVTQRGKGGFLPDDLQVKDGRIWRDEALDTPEEQDVFNLLGWYALPEQRTPDYKPPTAARIVLINRISQGHLEPGMSLDKWQHLMNEAGIARLDCASEDELRAIWERMKAL